MTHPDTVERPPRRWWLWAAVLVAVGLLVAGGIAVLLTAVRHHRAVVDVPTAAGLPRAGPDLQASAATLASSVASAVGAQPVSLAFDDPGGRSPLLLVGGRLGLTDNADAALLRATRAFAVSAFRSGTGPVAFTDQPAGSVGGRQRCSTVDVSGVRTAVCGWADRDTVGIAVSPIRTPEQLAELLGRARVDVER